MAQLESDLQRNDVCPICKSSTLNTPGLKFKVSPKCYHRICETCVDRRFASGKAECPIINCHQHLWKREWREQTFEDLKIEREVDIRRRVMKTLDRREEEFETKRDWDDFLEQREEMTMNLVLGTDLTGTNKKLRDYEQANGLAKKDTTLPDKELFKKAKVAPVKQHPEGTDPSGLIRGLKEVIAPTPKAIYDPFMGMPKRKDYYTLREDYSSRWDHEKADITVVAGGYDFQQFYDESLLRAFAGLGCFIEEERETSVAIKVVESVPLVRGSGDVF